MGGTAALWTERSITRRGEGPLAGAVFLGQRQGLGRVPRWSPLAAPWGEEGEQGRKLGTGAAWTFLPFPVEQEEGSSSQYGG